MHRDNSISVNIISLIIILIPIALVTGPFFPDLFATLVGIYFLFISINKKLLNYYNNKYVYFFVFFYFYILIRSIFSIIQKSNNSNQLVSDHKKTLQKYVLI